MKLTTKEREKLRHMFGGKCAYCGNALGNKFHADHVDPIFRGWIHNRPTRAGEDKLSNLFPACPRCNQWKSTLTIEGFRDAIKHQVFQLNRDSSNYRMAKDFSLITETESPVVFWFEKYDKEKNNG